MGEVNKNIHKGHRLRLLDTVFKAGIEDLSNIQALEFILFYIFPRGDVNPLAHRLLEKYKNIPSVLEAPVHDLVKIKGMGETSARKLSLLLNIFDRYTQEKATKQQRISNMGEIYDFIEALLRFKSREEFYMIGLDERGKVVGARCLLRGKIDLITMKLQDIKTFIKTFNAHGIILVHNHPGGSCQPSEKDLVSNAKLAESFYFADCNLVDNAVIGVDGIYSMKDRCLKRAFIQDKESYEKAIEELKSLSNTNGK